VGSTLREGRFRLEPPFKVTASAVFFLNRFRGLFRLGSALAPRFRFRVGSEPFLGLFVSDKSDKAPKSSPPTLSKRKIRKE